MDVFVFPSIYEGLPVTLVEAQASGLKCIVSDIITKQVLLSDLIEFVDLKKGPLYWAEKICESAYYHRNNMYETIMLSGFDIRNETHLLQQFYFKSAN
jgi:glycosyltransferase involved in cell wall biosynthesis